jgi:hypothetical protein
MKSAGFAEPVAFVIDRALADALADLQARQVLEQGFDFGSTGGGIDGRRDPPTRRAPFERYVLGRGVVTCGERELELGNALRVRGHQR